MEYFGQNFLFYAKYWDEIEKLYDEEDISLIQAIDNWKVIESDINQVGGAADKEARDFLSLVQTRISSQLLKLKRYVVIEKKCQYWEFESSIERKASPQKSGKRVQIGLFLDHPSEQTVLQPWIWMKGGRQAADALLELLKPGFLDEHGLERRQNNRIDLKPIILPSFSPNSCIPVNPTIDAVISQFNPIDVVPKFYPILSPLRRLGLLRCAL